MPKEVCRVGNLTNDPELRFIPDGKAVCNVDMAYTPYNPETKQQGEVQYYGLVIWQEMGEHVASSLSKGMRVIVQGNPNVREWDKDDGTKGSKKEIIVNAIGPDLRWTTCEVSKVNRTKQKEELPFEDDEEPF